MNVLRKAAYIVVRLYGAALENVGIDGSLCEEINARKLAGLFLEHADELFADDLSLALGLSNACELVEEAVNRIDVDEVGVHLVLENLDNLLGLTLAKKSVVNMNAHEILADCLNEKRSYNRAVNAARKSKQNLLVTDLRLYRSNLLVDKSLRKFGSGDAFHRIRSLVTVHSTIPP